jgi:hypothetical protein
MKDEGFFFLYQNNLIKLHKLKTYCASICQFMNFIHVEKTNENNNNNNSKQMQF